MHTKTILVIEDNEPIRRLISSHLAHAGYTVIEAVDGSEGWEFTRTYHPDLVLCDVMMPIMDGFAVIKAIRTNQETAATPCIIITSNDDPDVLRLGRQLGVKDFIIKPVLASALMDTVSNYLY
jgi:diguanylate cyclase